MTLVLQTTVETKPETNDAIKEVIARYGLREQAPSVSYGVDTFSYYSVPTHQDPKMIIHELMQLPGVASAYMKAGGMPPM